MLAGWLARGVSFILTPMDGVWTDPRTTERNDEIGSMLLGSSIRRRAWRVRPVGMRAT
jgi:hypothetical protein